MCGATWPYASYDVDIRIAATDSVVDFRIALAIFLYALTAQQPIDAGRDYGPEGVRSLRTLIAASNSALESLPSLSLSASTN